MSKKILAIHFQVLLIASLALCGFMGCATSEETVQIARSVTDAEVRRLSNETDRRFEQMAKEDEALRRQMVNLSASVEDNKEKIKVLFGKLDELEYQLRTYFNELKSQLGSLQKAGTQVSGGAPVQRTTPAASTKDYENAYKDAFEAFQKKSYEEAVRKFSAFVEAHPGTPLAPNALYWIGESHMSMKSYEKAILSFQELIDKYPKSDKVPRALLAQADAFAAVKDRKSSTTVLKKVIELFPKSEEAAIAERRLRN